jgi:ABC-type dipeptide/oligopeptide/nickel transport system permease component
LQGYDLPVILAVTLVSGAAIILFNLVADLVVMALDPTLTRSSRRRLLRLAGRTA